MQAKEDSKTDKKEEKTQITKKKESKKLSLLEFEKRVVELADKGLTAEKIGELLRKEGIHPKDFDKKISKILKEKNKYVDPDLKNVGIKLERIKTHFEKNKQDKRALREKDRVFSQLRKLKIYNKIPLK